MCCFSRTGDRFHKNRKFQKVCFSLKIRPKIMLETSMFESSENHTKMIPKWSQNPSKIHQKSIQKSRSEKGRPKINKNRGPGRPRLENVATTFPRLMRLWPGGVPAMKERRTEGAMITKVIPTRTVARRICNPICHYNLQSDLPL